MRDLSSPSCLMLTAGLQPGFGLPMVAVLDLWSPEYVLGGPGAAALPKVPVASSGEELCFWQCCLGLRGPAGQKIMLFSQQLWYSVSFALNHWYLLPTWNCLALTWSHWISFHKLVRVLGVSKGNTSDHKYFLLICRHQPLVI